MSTTQELVERLQNVSEWKQVIERHRRITDDPRISYVLQDGTRVHEDEDVIAKLAASLSRALEDAANTASAAAARLSELEAGDGWMPIETAPKDVAVLIFVHGETQKAVLQQTPLHGPIWFDTNYDMTTWNPTSVTHWRPLPTPPAAREPRS